MEGNIETIDTSLVKAQEYLKGKKDSMRALFEGVEDGKFAKEYDLTLEDAQTAAFESVDQHDYRISGENMPDSDDIRAERVIAIADFIQKYLTNALEDYQSGKAVVPSSESRQEKINKVGGGFDY